MYENIVNALRCYAKDEECYRCEYFSEAGCDIDGMLFDAADAIEERCQQVDKFMEEAARLYAKQPKWIPVAERLPNPGSVVLAYSSEFFSMIAYYNTENEWSVPDAFITHWMPLPEPPKEET